MLHYTFKRYVVPIKNGKKYFSVYHKKKHIFKPQMSLDITKVTKLTMSHMRMNGVLKFIQLFLIDCIRSTKRNINVLDLFILQSQNMKQPIDSCNNCNEINNRIVVFFFDNLHCTKVKLDNINDDSSSCATDVYELVS